MTYPFVRIESTTPQGVVSAKIGIVGAGVQEFLFGEREVIPQGSDEAQQKWFAAVALAPWPNRLQDGVWSFEGQSLQGRLNDSLGHALHGLVFNKEFDVEQSSPDAVRMHFRLGADAVYPFDVRITFSYRVDSTGLVCTMEAQNLGSTKAPVGLGVHPYFPYRDDTTITCPGSKYFEVNSRLIPTGPLNPAAGKGVTPGEPSVLRGFVVDDCFTELTRDADGLAHTVLTYADGWETDVWQDEALPHTVVFTKPGFPWAHTKAHGIAIEPQTCPTNALQSGTDLVWLEPQEHFVAQWGIAVRPSEQGDSV